MTRIVIVGGGFAGVAVAQELQRRLPVRDADVTMVSRDNFLLFHPMLPEVAGGSIEAHHILSPIRQLCPRATVTLGLVDQIDLDKKTVFVSHGPHGAVTPIFYDTLVVAVGAVTNFSELTGMAQHALGLKTIGDALYLRNHIINMLEEADVETDPARRRELLTFVVAGGGFSGVEMVAELNDFVHQTRRYYHRVRADDIRVVLLHAGNRILPELNENLAAFALKHLERRGIEVRLETMLGGATEDEALIKDADPIATRTLVCTIGTATNPLIGKLPCSKDERGRIVVSSSLEVEGWPDVWALGDCAAVPNQATGALAPPTAQFAQREGKLVARNIVARLRGDAPRSFDFPGLGQFVSLGHRSAVAEILRFRIAGFIAWFMWRTVYLAKLPGLSRKARVALDWTLDLLFGRDITQLPLARGERVGRAHYEPGDVIVQQGDIGDLFYVITTGEVEVVRYAQDGSEHPITHLRQGDYFGELALLHAGTRNATVRAVSPVNVLTLGRDDFTVLAKNWAGLREVLIDAARERGE
ncbi:MAG TPA: FAD-dependent oxidoreductase [Chloroflexota bacterium]|nr:FAD-dependent oxidoreductase [Chloroflexota bacterium]